MTKTSFPSHLSYGSQDQEFPSQKRRFSIFIPRVICIQNYKFIPYDFGALVSHCARRLYSCAHYRGR